jgi:hypothetical protein
MFSGSGYRICVNHWRLHSWSFTQRPCISAIGSRTIRLDTTYSYDFSARLRHLPEATHSRKVYTTVCRRCAWSHWQNISYIGLDTNDFWFRNA